MVVVCGINSNCCPLLSWGMNQIKTTQVGPFMGFGFSNGRTSLLQSTTGFTTFTMKVKTISPVKCHLYQNGQSQSNSKASKKKKIKKVKKKEHHLWKKRESSGSGKKALTLVRIVSELPNEKEAVYGALDKWTAWETEFPFIAAAKALNMLRQRGQWWRVIQVAKWMLSKGQGATMGTYDTLLLAFDKDKRADEAESLWNMILHTHTRSISKRLFSRMISLYDHHDMQDKIIDVNNMGAIASYPSLNEIDSPVFADMEELGVKPDEDTIQRVARAFQKLGEKEKWKLVLAKYQCKWKYIHFKGERVKVRRDVWEYNGSTD